MSKLIIPGRFIYSTGIIALAVLCMVSKDFIVGRPPGWPAGFKFNPALAYISGVVLIIAAIAIILKRKARLAAFLISALIFFFSVLRHLPNFMNDWANAYKSLALVGGSLIIAASFPVQDLTKDSGFKANDRWRAVLITIGCISLAAFFIACGYAHFKFADFIESFIPSYIPFHVFWTYFCGICLFAGGVGLLIPQTRRPAALLSGFMVLGWFLLLHIPRLIANMNDASDRLGLCESFTLVGIFFVLAGILNSRCDLKMQL
ncbi:MAG TPA: hypothetical protein VKI61_16190, partial [Chitinophagaceae bacterium]|nr:hypothetical protein [Chitinophagaceae bacterium]